MTIAAYRLDIEYRFGVTLRRKGVERCAEVTCDSPLFANVCQAVREQHPGWSIWESWEIAAAEAPAAELARTAADAQISRHYRKLAAAA